MDFYTLGSHDGHMAIIEKANVGAPYPFSMNMTDFRVFVTILQKLALYDSVSHKDIPSIPGYDDEETEALGNWAASWYSGIAETLGIELI